MAAENSSELERRYRNFLYVFQISKITSYTAVIASADELSLFLTIQYCNLLWDLALADVTSVSKPN